MKTLRRVLLVSLASILFALNLNTFVKAAEILPGGFAGLSLLLRELILRGTGINLPFSLPFYLLNAVPAYICFRFVGKWFTLLSCVCVFLTGILTDMMPGVFLEYLSLGDNLLSAVFGGLLNGAAISVCLRAGAASGGADLIAVYFAEKQGRDTWNYILLANCLMLVVAGVVWTPEAALYSIIFQWVSTQTMSRLYTAYQQKTLLIITTKPDEVYSLIREKTHHAATAFSGVGQFEHSTRVMLYSVVSAGEVRGLVAAIRQVDAAAFVNVLRTEQINGRFYRPPKD